MPTETGGSLAKQIRESYAQLSAASSELNAASDALGKQVAALDQALKRLNLGVSTWVSIQGHDDHDTGQYWSEDLGYTRVGRKWGIALRTTSGNYNYPDGDDLELWLFNDAPRRLRIAGIDRLPDLLQKLIVEANTSTKHIKDKTRKAQEFAEAIIASTTPVSSRKERGTRQAGNGDL